MEKPSGKGSGIYRGSPDRRGPHRGSLMGTCVTRFISSPKRYSDGKDGFGGRGGGVVEEPETQPSVPAPVKQLPIDVEGRLSAEHGFVQDVPFTSLPTQRCHY